MKFENKDVLKKFESYPVEIREKLEYLRSLIFAVAREDKINDIEETLKWGEPSYLSKRGSTLRIDWKKKNPERYSIYFNCNTKLIYTFKEIYPDTFNYVGNREIFFGLDEALPTEELKHCIALSLKYHSVKKLPLLGVFST